MSVLVVPEEVSRFLNGRVGEVELRDQVGRSPGRLTPPVSNLSPEYEAMLADCPDTDADLDRVRAEGGGRPLAEIWQRLGQIK